MNISPDTNNTIDFEKFDLSWRWGQKHNPNITGEEKQLIVPYSEEESKRLNKIIGYFEVESNLRKDYEEFDWISASIDIKENIQKVREVLSRHFSDCSPEVIISWDRRTCISTNKEIFFKFWDDFCYPSSDDVTVISTDTGVILKYNHIEVIKIWRRKTNTQHSV
jgi:hypothetical protein